jgi:hypothetical protein
MFAGSFPSPFALALLAVSGRKGLLLRMAGSDHLADIFLKGLS